MDSVTGHISAGGICTICQQFKLTIYGFPTTEITLQRKTGISGVYPLKRFFFLFSNSLRTAQHQTAPNNNELPTFYLL
jgi:hypothetical protein